MNTITQRKAAFKAGSALQALSLRPRQLRLQMPFAAPQDTQDASVGPIESQDASTTDASGSASTGQGIVVTGSRIRQPNLESASPVTVVSAEEITQTGTTRVEDLVNSLPQVFAAQGSNVSNGSTGTATLNLRGLGSERTLVLVNGRRLVPGDPTPRLPTST